MFICLEDTPIFNFIYDMIYFALLTSTVWLTKRMRAIVASIIKFLVKKPIRGMENSVAENRKG